MMRLFSKKLPVVELSFLNFCKLRLVEIMFPETN